MSTTRKQRNPKGSMVALAMVGLIPLLIAFGAFAVEMMHINAVQSELQKACDAGALAGAQYLYKYTTGGGPAAIEARARMVSGLNLADGRFVLASSPNTTVDVVITGPQLAPVPKGTKTPSGHGHGSGKSSGKGKGSGHGAGHYVMGGSVRVTAKMGIDNMFSKVFNRPFEIVTATALAGPTGGASGAGVAQTYPLAVSLDANGPDGTPLSAHQVGDNYQLSWADNVAWTGNASKVKDAIDHYMEPNATSQNSTPPLRVGDNIDLNNGSQAVNQSAMAGDAGEIINMPVFKGTGPYNYTTPIVGFISMQLTSVSGGIVTGKLVVGTFHGTTGYVPPASLTNAEDDFISDMAVQPIKLLE